VCARVCEDRGAQLLVGAGTNDTATTVSRHAALAGVPSVVASLAVVPYYVRPSEAAIVAHFEFVAARSPVPLVVYNIPYRTGRGLGAAALLALSATEGIVGVKQAVGGIDSDTLEVLSRSPSGFAVLGGDDAYLVPIVFMGGAGAIAASANVCTKRFVAMIDAALAGDVPTARQHAEALLPLVLALFAEPSPAISRLCFTPRDIYPHRRCVCRWLPRRQQACAPRTQRWRPPATPDGSGNIPERWRSRAPCGLSV
jgi:4-hydroxy-tetrahydrodipicolinate synthase